MKEKPYYPVVYMFVITCVFSLLLIGLAQITREEIEVNVQLAFERAVVGVFEDISAKSNPQVHQIFAERFKFDDVTQSYLYSENGRLLGYAVPFAGPGFWDDIEGILGIDADRTTVRGILFYEQAETPGLGARIDEEDFRKQFVGIKIKHAAQPIGIRPATRELRENEIHAITGATQTSVRLEKLINDRLTQWFKVLGEQSTVNQEATP